MFTIGSRAVMCEYGIARAGITIEARRTRTAVNCMVVVVGGDVGVNLGFVKLNGKSQAVESTMSVYIHAKKVKVYAPTSADPNDM